MGAAASHMEKKGVKTGIGNLNRDIQAANRLMRSIRQTVRSLKGWLSDLKEKKAALMEALTQTREPTLPELLSRYMDLRREERSDWTAKGQLKGAVSDFNKVMAAIDFLQKQEISTVERLDKRLDEISQTAQSIRKEMKKSERRINAIDTLLSHIDRYEAAKPVHAEYAAIRWKGKKEKFAAAHRDELDAYNAAVRYFKANLKGGKYSRNDLTAERKTLSDSQPEQTEKLETVQADLNVLRDVRYWINQVLPPEQYRQPPEADGRKSLQSELKGRAERNKRQQAAQSQPPRPQKKQDMEL